MIAVHAGVGRHRPETAQLCAEALKFAKGDAVSAVTFLEKDFRTNCGAGSALTEVGTVECEAAFMSSEGMAFGAVGAVTNCMHPSLLAQRLALSQRHVPDGPIPPSLVVGSGAEQLALDFGVPVCSNAALISPSARDTHKRARLAFDSCFDTVGALDMEKDGTCSASVSSGGLICKKSGRLGHSVLFGCGVWAEKAQNLSVAVTLSGCGEMIARTRLAQRLAEAVLEAATVQKHFVDSALLGAYEPSRKKVGGLVAVSLGPGLTELVAFHNTDHLPLAFSTGRSTRHRLLTRPDGEDFVLESFLLRGAE